MSRIGKVPVTIPSGATTATITIDPTVDGTVEADETVTLTVAGADEPEASGAPVLSAKDMGPEGAMPAGDDTVASTGKAGDAPVVLPGTSDDLGVDTRALSDRSTNRDGDPSLTVMDDGGVLGDPDGTFDFGLGDADADGFGNMWCSLWHSVQLRSQQEF